MADDDDAFAMHLGVMGSKLSFSERLKQARQLDALLEAFSDDLDDSGAPTRARASPARTLRSAASSAWPQAEPSLAHPPPVSPSPSRSRRRRVVGRRRRRRGGVATRHCRGRCCAATHPHAFRLRRRLRRLDPRGDRLQRVVAPVVVDAAPRRWSDRQTRSRPPPAAAAAAVAALPRRSRWRAGAVVAVVVVVVVVAVVVAMARRCAAAVLTQVRDYLISHSLTRFWRRAGVESMLDASPGGTDPGTGSGAASGPGARQPARTRPLHTILGSGGRCGTGLSERRSGSTLSSTLGAGGGGCGERGGWWAYMRVAWRDLGCRIGLPFGHPCGHAFGHSLGHPLGHPLGVARGQRAEAQAAEYWYW